MSFSYNETQLSIIESVQNIMKNFDDDYWLNCDRESKFPHGFYEEVLARVMRALKLWELKIRMLTK